MARVKQNNFKDVELYNGAGADIPAFDLSMGGSTSRSPVGKLGVSASYDPETASEFASLAARGGEGQNIMPLRYRSAKEGVITLDSSMGNLEIAGAVQDAWGAGYDAIKFKNYTTPGGKTGKEFVLVKDPAQRR